MTFLWAWLLGLLLVSLPLLVGGYLWSLRRRGPVGVRYSSLALLRDVVPRTDRLRRHVPFALLLAAVAIWLLEPARRRRLLDSSQRCCNSRRAGRPRPVRFGRAASRRSLTNAD